MIEFENIGIKKRQIIFVSILIIIIISSALIFSIYNPISNSHKNENVICVDVQEDFNGIESSEQADARIKHVNSRTEGKYTVLNVTKLSDGHHIKIKNNNNETIDKIDSIGKNKYMMGQENISATEYSESGRKSTLFD